MIRVNVRERPSLLSGPAILVRNAMTTVTTLNAGVASYLGLFAVRDGDKSPIQHIHA